MEFVFANMDGLVLNSGAGQVMLHRGDVWFADDPFVQARPELFSETPLFVHSTTGRLTPPATPVGQRRAAAEARADEIAERIISGRRGRRASA